MAGAHIDTRYVQTDKQQFAGMLTKADKHNNKQFPRFHWRKTFGG